MSDVKGREKVVNQRPFTMLIHNVMQWTVNVTVFLQLGVMFSVSLMKAWEKAFNMSLKVVSHTYMIID